MATFRKRGTKWSYRIDIGRDPVTNERRQITVSGFNTKKEAQTAAATHQHELDSGTHVKEKEITFPELVNDWMKVYSKNVKVSTIRIRRYEAERLLKFFEKMKAKDITKRMYQNAITDLSESGLENQTIEGIHTTGKMLFRHAIEFDMIKTNPTINTKLFKQQQTVEQIENAEEIPKFLEKDQLSLFLKTAREQGLEGDYVIFLTLAYSGMRCGELCALKKSDFDFSNNTLSITKTRYSETGDTKNYELLTPKTKKSIRKIDLDPIVLKIIEEHIAVQNEFKMLHRKTYHDKGFVFANMQHSPGYPRRLHMVGFRMNRLLKLAGLDTQLTPHSLRHTHTSLLAEAGVSLPEIMDRLGHQDDKTTKSVYLHITKTKKKEAAEKFSLLMKDL